MKKELKEYSAPDSAVRYILSNYLIRKSTEGVAVVQGVSHEVVETVLELFLDWAYENVGSDSPIYSLNEEE